MYQCGRCSSKALSGALYCAKHNNTPITQAQRKAPTGKSVYNTPRWRGLRKGALLEQPLCMACSLYGRVLPAEDVDHIYPISHSPSLAYTKSNLQCLCKGCHSRKTGHEKKGLIYDYRNRRVVNIHTGHTTPIPV